MGRILIVDDDRLFRWAVRDILERTGYSVLEAGDRAGALALLAPDIELILLDGHLPDGLGLDLLLEIKGSRQNGCPVVMLTSHPTAGDRLEAERRGALAYHEKPADLDAIVALVESARTRVAKISR